jgi:N-acetylneuraminate synthase
MRIEKSIGSYIILEDESIQHALAKLNNNKSRILFVVSAYGKLLGSLTDGDIRRWLIDSKSVDLDITVKLVMNTNFSSFHSDARRIDITAKLNDQITAIPLVDDINRIVAIAFRDKAGFKIGNVLISDESSAFVIAEIGNNHQGDIELAKKLVVKAKEAGANCAKFQLRNLNSLYRKSESEDLGTEYTMDFLNKFSLSIDEMIEVFDYCKSVDIVPLCTPWDISSLGVLEVYGMPAYKVASADFTNHELLAALCATGKPLICSTGMSAESEIRQSISFLDEQEATYILLHCNSTYPTPYKDVNLSYMSRLKEMSSGMVGYSGHERGISVPVAAVAMGAKVIEKHITLDQDLEGNDHKVSLLPNEFSKMIQHIREVEASMGNRDPREISQGELLNREILAKSLVSTAGIKAGQIITRDLIGVTSPGQGLQPNFLEELVGRRANRTIEEGGCFYPADLEDVAVSAKDYNFSRPFGIPIRYHDFKTLSDKSNLDFVEFHLSYRDMEFDIAGLFSKTTDLNFAVHCPELFSNDHLLNLASADPDYQRKSIENLRDIIDITIQIGSFFPNTKKPVLVLNAGGFNTTGFLDLISKKTMYRRIGDALKLLDLTGITLAIQTMPPFPWHFGGQSHHNLFVDAKEISDFCSSEGVKVCLDISHTQMACNYYQWDLYEFIEEISEHVVHLHIADAKGIDGEGVEVGQGDVDFERLSQSLTQYCPNVQFIPEIWQGHKNEGEGFWKALEFLEPFKL